MQCMLVCSVVSNSLQSHGLWPARLLHPWNFPGKHTAVGCTTPGDRPDWGWNPCLLCLLNLLPWHVGALPLWPLGSLCMQWRLSVRRPCDPRIEFKMLQSILQTFKITWLNEVERVLTKVNLKMNGVQY